MSGRQTVGDVAGLGPAARLSNPELLRLPALPFFSL